MKHHYIICAMGETGIYVIEEFIKTKNPLVIITTDKRITERFTPHGIPMIEDNPDEDETLKKAGIDRAVGLVAVLGEDKDNLFVVLSARGLNPDCKIVAQAIESDTVAKLQKAGADEVVLTDMIGGMRIASVMLRAKVVTFLDSMLKQPGEVLRVEEATVQEGSYLDAKTIEKSEVTKRTGLVIIATREHASGKFIHNPKPDYQIKAGDTLIVIGTPDQVNELKKLAHHPESA
jgi:voltage-gated potassium channel